MKRLAKKFVKFVNILLVKSLQCTIIVQYLDSLYKIRIILICITGRIPLLDYDGEVAEIIELVMSDAFLNSVVNKL